MKYISLFILVFCVFIGKSFGQTSLTTTDCQEITKIITDKKKGVSRVVSKEEIRINDLHGHGLFQIVILRMEEDYSFIIKSLKNECFDQKTEVHVFFRNGNSMSFESNNKNNCDSFLVFSLKDKENEEKVMNEFLNGHIIGIQFESAKKNDYRLKIETPQTELIQEIFKCMSVGL